MASKWNEEKLKWRENRNQWRRKAWNEEAKEEKAAEAIENEIMK